MNAQRVVLCINGQTNYSCKIAASNGRLGDAHELADRVAFVATTVVR